MNCIYEIIRTEGEQYLLQCRACSHQRWSKYPPEKVHRPCGWDGQTVQRPKEKITGLGDLIESALSTAGITKQRVERWLGRPCRCKERQEKLNQLGWWAVDVVKGKRTNPTEDLLNLLAKKK
jgi:hypothetical protein